MFQRGGSFLKKFIWKETKHNCYKNILLQLLVCLEVSSYIDCSGGRDVGLAPGPTGRAGQPLSVCLPQLHQSNNPWQRERCSLQKLLNCRNIRLWLNHLPLSPEISMSFWCAVSHLWTLSFAPLVMIFGFPECVNNSPWSHSTWLQNYAAAGSNTGWASHMFGHVVFLLATCEHDNE